MFKLIRNVNIVNGLKNSRIADGNLARRNFCDAPPRTEKSKYHHNINFYANIEVNSVSKCYLAINSVRLLGRVGAELQQKGTAANPVISFGMATQSYYK